MTISTLPPSNATQALFSHLLSPASASSSKASTSALRLDNRDPATPLSPSISYSASQRGNLTLTLSSPRSTHRTKTIIQASVYANLIEPRQERPYEGQVNLNVNTSLAFGSSSATRSNGSADAITAELERQLDLSLRRSGLIDREALCLKAGQAVWNITINLHVQCIEGGNALSACVLAASLALADFRKQDAEVGEGGTVVVYDESERVSVPLPITGGLVAIEIAVYLPPLPTSGTRSLTSSHLGFAEPIFLLDPTPLEVQLSSALLSYVLAPNTGQFLVSEKIGRAPLSVETVLTGMKLAERRAKQIGAWQETTRKQRDEIVNEEIQ